MIRRTLLLPVLAAAALGLVACNGGGNDTGNGGSPGTTAASSPSAGKTSTSSASGPLASTNPCSLLTATEKTQAGLSKEEKTDSSKVFKNSPGQHGCSWDKTGQYNLVLMLDNTIGLTDIPTSAGQQTKEPIGNHDGVQTVTSAGCVASIGVATHARVDVFVVTSTDDTTTECQLANNYAKIIEPRLPAQQ